MNIPNKKFPEPRKFPPLNPSEPESTIESVLGGCVNGDGDRHRDGLSGEAAGAKDYSAYII